jgi:hypothetical protein
MRSRAIAIAIVHGQSSRIEILGVYVAIDRKTGIDVIKGAAWVTVPGITVAAASGGKHGRLGAGRQSERGGKQEKQAFHGGPW